MIAAVVLAGCGARVVADATADADAGTTSGTGGATTSTTGAMGGATTTTSTTTTTTITTGFEDCTGAMCGTYCEACFPECVPGHCDGAGTCVPEVFSEPPLCPPPDQVVSGVACDTEGAFCPSDASCSGYLQCRCGAWVLINPC